jgi:kinetochore protein Spc7/SPC105
MNLNHPDEYFSSSPCSSPAGTEKSFVEMEASGSDTDSMDDHDTISDKTFMTEAGEATMGDGEPMRMDMDMDMDMDDDDTTAAFRQPIFKKPPQWRLEDGETAAMPSSPPVLQLSTPAPVDLGEGGEMTMEVTEPVSGLLQTAEAKKPTPFSFSPRTPQKADDGEMAMEMPGPLGGLLLRGVPVPQTHQGQDDEDDPMEITRVVGGILRPLNGQSPKREDNDAEMDMDMTQPTGGIINASKSRMSLGFSQYQDDDADLPMDITRPIGGIISMPGPQVISPAHSSTSDSNENMTMEFASVLGGIISQAPKHVAGRAGKLISGDDWAKDQADKQKQSSREDTHVDDDKEKHTPIDPFTVRQSSSSQKEQMDMASLVAEKLDALATVAYPALPVLEEKDEDQDMDVDMEITVNVGCILQSRVAEEQEPSPEIATSNQTTENVQSVSPSTVLNNSEDITPAQVASPTPRAKRNTRRSSGAARTARLTRAQRKSLEADQGSTPQPSPAPGKITTPKKASSPKSKVPMPAKTVTPTKAQPAPIPQQPTPQKVGTPQLSTPPERVTPMVATMKPTTPSKQNPKLQTPVRPRGIDSGFSLSAKKDIVFRRSPSPVKNQSAPMRTPLRGMGINRIGLGSPTINQRLSARKSLVEDTMAFSPIAIPSALLQATCDDREKDEQEKREEKARREEEHKKMDLKSRISLLTPRKAGRQSLAIGTLVPGKRALESPGESSKKRRKSVGGGDTVVDEIDEEACEKLRASLRSGYTSGMLPMPVSAKNTPKTPRTGSFPRPTPAATPAATPVRVAVSLGGDGQMEGQEQTEETASREEEKEEENESMVDEDEVRVSFPEFLDLIGISFLDDLQAASGRRHTGSASSSQRPSLGMDGGPEASLAERIIAAAGTAPLLELYQHACRELKQYIQGGRDCVKEIESKAYADNPPLFKEYLYSPPDIRAIMDTQFKNIKTHARLQAKGIWYEWRQKLLEGVLTALRQNLKGLQEDQEVIKKQDEIIAQMLPDIEKEHEEAKDKLEKIEKLEKRIAMDDPEELDEARSRLREILDKTAAVREQVLRKRQDVEALNSEIEIKEKKKAELAASIEEAERIKEMNRGWSEEEVKTWKTRCENLERESGWCITAALPDSRLEMMYKREIKLTCDPEGNAAPWVEYHYSLSGKPSERKPMPKVEREFFLNSLNTILAHERDPKVVLKVVSNFWGNALGVIDSISHLRKQHYIEVRATDDGDLKVKATVLVQELRSKMEIGFVVSKERPQVKHAGVRVVYGAISQQAVQDMLMQWTGEWRDGVNEAVERCLEDRRRGGVVVGVKG